MQISTIQHLNNFVSFIDVQTAHIKTEEIQPHIRAHSEIIGFQLGPMVSPRKMKCAQCRSAQCMLLFPLRIKELGAIFRAFICILYAFSAHSITNYHFAIHLCCAYNLYTLYSVHIPPYDRIHFVHSDCPHKCLSFHSSSALSHQLLNKSP